ncbi:glycosyltransferase [Paracoccus sp. NBH48]|uniref:glycosyltransferase n=1 Tax=Paracoccus sp. NBH48 TaxID=2596918 RepID=UPI002106F636|nr:glycosyltransferase [Paracoccus sp. NBH48]
MSVLNKTAAVIVTFNRSGKLMAVLDALAAQTLRPDIVLVVDNASTDDTAALVQARADGDPTIRHLRLPANVGGAGGFMPGSRQPTRWARSISGCRTTMPIPDRTPCNPCIGP